MAVKTARYDTPLALIRAEARPKYLSDFLATTLTYLWLTSRM